MKRMKRVAPDIDPFEFLENDLHSYLSAGKILIFGDFNARIGLLEDCITDCLPINVQNDCDDIVKRNNKDNLC